MNLRLGLNFIVSFLLIVLPLAMGGAHSTTQVIVLFLVLVTVMTTGRFLWSKENIKNPVVQLLLGFMVVSFMQAVPLPLFFIKWLSTESYGIWSDADFVAMFAPLSLAPIKTLTNLLQMFCILNMSLCALVLYSDKDLFVRFLKMQSLIAGLVFAVSCVHSIADVDLVWGKFGYIHNGLSAPFVNANHLATYLGFSSFLALAVFLVEKSHQKIIYLVLAMLFGLGVFLSLSRAGIVCFATTVCLTVVIAVILQHRLKKNVIFLGTYRRVISLLGAILAIGGMAYVIAGHSIAVELMTLEDRSTLNKIDLWQMSWPIVKDFLWTGIGTGALAGVFPRYAATGFHATVYYIENTVLQILLDNGLVVLFGVVGVLVVVAKRFWQTLRSSPEYLPLAGALLFVTTHSLFEFSIQLLAVSIPVLMLLASSCQIKKEIRHDKLVLVRPSPLVMISSALIVAMSGMVWQFEKQISKEAIHQVFLKCHTDNNCKPTFLQVLSANPADPVLPLYVAEEYLQTKSTAWDDIFYWLNQSLKRAPHYYDSHRLLAQSLWRYGAREQALSEYRYLFANAPAKTGDLVDELLERTKNKDAWLGVTSDLQEDVMNTITNLLRARQQSTLALSLYEGHYTTNSPTTLKTLALLHLELQNADWAEKFAEQLQATTPNDEEGYLLLAKASLLKNDYEQALHFMDHGLQLNHHYELYAPIMLRSLLALDRFNEAETFVSKLLARAGTRADRAWAWSYLAIIFAEQQDWPKAIAHYKKALAEAPEVDSFSLELSRILLSVGQTQQALQVLVRAQPEAQNKRKINAEIQRLRANVELLSADTIKVR